MRRWRKVNWKPRLIILVTLALILVVQKQLGVYLVEEAFTVLLAIAVVLILMLLIAIAFLLLWEGASLVFLWLTGLVDRMTSIGDRPLRPDQAISHPLPRH